MSNDRVSGIQQDMRLPAWNVRYHSLPHLCVSVHDVPSRLLLRRRQWCSYRHVPTRVSVANLILARRPLPQRTPTTACSRVQLLLSRWLIFCNGICVPSWKVLDCNQQLDTRALHKLPNGLVLRLQRLLRPPTARPARTPTSRTWYLRRLVFHARQATCAPRARSRPPLALLDSGARSAPLRAQSARQGSIAPLTPPPITCL